MGDRVVVNCINVFAYVGINSSPDGLILLKRYVDYSTPVHCTKRRNIPQSRSKAGIRMKAFIHNFKLWYEGFLSPVGSVYSVIESPRR